MCSGLVGFGRDGGVAILTSADGGPVGSIHTVTASTGVASTRPVGARVGSAAVHPVQTEADAWFATRPSCGHTWPPEIEPSCACLRCGRHYDEYAE